MDLSLYAKLHGMLHVIKPSGTESNSIDASMEADIDTYIALVLEEEKEKFQEGIESFETHANKLRAQVQKAMHEYCESVARGYKAICEIFESQNKSLPAISTNNLEIFNDTVKLTEALAHGLSMYQLLGFSYDTLLEFHSALNAHFEAEEYAKTRDGFFFLITIAPEFAIFWAGLGVAYVKLQEYSEAQEMFLKAIELDPTAKESYLSCIHAYVKTSKKDAAVELLSKGLAYARSNVTETWAQDLEETLLDAQSVIKEM